MEGNHQRELKNSQNTARIYFILGYFFLLVMSLLWSVDRSLILISFGTGVFFLFLGFRQLSTKKNANYQFSNRSQSGKQTAEARSAFDGLRNIFRGNGGNATSMHSSTSPQSTGAVSIIKLISMAVFGIFFVFFVLALFGSSDADDAITYYETAEQNYSSENYDSAYVNYRKAWKLNPEYTEALLGYANVMAIRNDQDSALIMIDKALDIDPDNKDASYSKALTYYNQKKYDESIAVLEPLREANPDYYMATLLMGDCYYIQQKFDNAIVLYEDAYANGGNGSRILCHVMAYIYDTKGEYDKAISLYKEALSYDSSIVDIYSRLGQLLQGEDGNVYRSKAVLLQQK